MPPDNAWSDQYNKSGINLSSAGVEWKNFMKECLIETEVFKKSDLDVLNGRCLTLDQNIKIDKRHEMVRDHESIKTFPIPKEQIQTEARKYLREETHKKLQKQKEYKIITKEIERLKNLLENYRKSSQIDLKEATTEKVKHTIKPKLGGRYTRLWKRLESYEGYCEIDNWMSSSVQMTMETKISPEGTPFAVKVYVTKKEEVQGDRVSQPVSWNRKGSTATDDDNRLYTNPWDNSEKSGKDEIMKRYLETMTKPAEVLNNKYTTRLITKTSQNDLVIDIKQQDSPTFIEDIPQINDQIDKYIKKRKLQQIWTAWKTYTIKNKQRKNTRSNYQQKIEKFLTKLQESQTLIKTQQVKEVTKIRKPQNRIISQEDIHKKQIQFLQNEQKKKQKQKEILKQVITSQKESQERLLNIKKRRKGVLNGVQTDVGVPESDKKLPEFLLRMEKRREERSNRWKDIKERKKQLEEERKRCEKQKQEEMKMLEEAAKKQKLEEIKQRRKTEKERKEKERLEREKLKAQIKQADLSYRKLLIRSYGWVPWRNLIRKRLQQEEVANRFRDVQLILKTFRHWKIEVNNEVEKRIKEAKEYFEMKLLKHFFWIWMTVCEERKNQLQVAVDWNDLKITEKCFKTWMSFIEEEQLKMIEKEEMADQNYEKTLKRKYLKIWINYPELKRQEKAKEERKRIWRQKVQEILPDYRPIILSTNQEDFLIDNILPYR